MPAVDAASGDAEMAHDRAGPFGGCLEVIAAVVAATWTPDEDGLVVKRRSLQEPKRPLSIDETAHELRRCLKGRDDTRIGDQSGSEQG